MNNRSFHLLVEKEKERIEKLMDTVDGYLTGAPAGTLWPRKCRGRYYYSISYPGSSKEEKRSVRYLSKKDEHFAAMMRKYCADRMRGVLKEQSVLLSQLTYDWDRIDREFSRLYEIFGEMLPEKLLPKEAFVEKWLSTEYEKSTMEIPPERAVKSAAGEVFRSKNEAMAASVFLRLGVPYHYEEKLCLPDGRTVYPDFTAHSPVNGKKFYVEIFGMMSDPGYLAGAARKLETYAKNGFVIGENLLVFFEFNDTHFDIGIFESTIRKKLLEQ